MEMIQSLATHPDLFQQSVSLIYRDLKVFFSRQLLIHSQSQMCLPFVYQAYNFVNCLCLYCHFLCVVERYYWTEAVVAELFVFVGALCWMLLRVFGFLNTSVQYYLNSKVVPQPFVTSQPRSFSAVIVLWLLVICFFQHSRLFQFHH